MGTRGGHIGQQETIEVPGGEEYPLLARIAGPRDVQQLVPSALPALCGELREFIVRSVSSNPGHLGASLGVVELAVALLYSYTPPEDKLIWDVGHQAYPYKILTGRREAFSQNRRWHGLSGFPSRYESLYDAFGTGHSSTSISAGLGMSVAAQLQGTHYHTVAIIGDGALTGGMAFEALDQGGALQSDLLVILNDNHMSIDPNVGALKDYLLGIATSPAYNHLKGFVWRLLGKLQLPKANIQQHAQQIDQAIKGALLEDSNFFEALGFRYFGPVDGHDPLRLIDVLQDLKRLPGPKLLHCITVKGKGYRPAEENKTLWHAPGRFDYQTGQIIKSDATPRPKFQDVFGKHLVELAQRNLKVVGITAAMPTGTSIRMLQEAYPERTFDVGIAEQHAVTFAAGLATQGYIPFCAIYSTFLQRAFDQIIHDVALQNLHVVFCVDRAGLVGDDGATHHGTFDLAYLRTIPNLHIASPMDARELRAMLDLALLSAGPWVVRYPRGEALEGLPELEKPAVVTLQARKLHTGQDAVVLSVGTIGWNVREAVAQLAHEGLELTHYDVRFVKPLDAAMLTEIATFAHVYTVEEGCLMGGFGSAVLEALADRGYHGTLVRIGLPDRFIRQGHIDELRSEVGLLPAQIAARIRQDLLMAKAPIRA